MEGPPKPSQESANTAARKTVAGPRYPETFGIPPHIFENEQFVPAVIRRLAGDLRAAEKGTGTEEDTRKRFSRTYSAKKIEDDLVEVRRLESVWEKEDDLESRLSHLYATVMEVIIEEMANGWFPGAVAWKSSRFDDTKRQTDLFMEVDGADSHRYPLAVDVTTSWDSAVKKIDGKDGRSGISETHRRGQFHDVEYFDPETNDEDDGGDDEPAPQRPPVGRAFMPRVIMGISRKGVAQLARLYGMVQFADQRPAGMSRTQAQERLRLHGVGGQLYEEVLHQLEAEHDSLRGLLKQTPTDQTTKRGVFKERAQYVDQISRALRKSYAAWRKDQEAAIKRDPALEKELEALPNTILDAIKERL